MQLAKRRGQNTKFFHGVASSRRRANRIQSIMVGGKRLEKKEEIISHIIDYFHSLYTAEGWERPYLGNLDFETIGEEEAEWLERNFEEVRQVVFDLAGDKAPGPDGFPMAFFLRFWKLLKKDVMDFIGEFSRRGKLSKGLGASFIALIPKKVGDLGIKDYRPISLLGSPYKILTKVLAGWMQKILPKISSNKQGAFVEGRQILDDILVANECVHSRLRRGIRGSFAG
eukprot:TRINITY_DN16210_c0_g1_i8.p2 TRINITY_DN16210_c0_g1~~TRINITY_DN16210_c0_g1_i8.p2  ORF type:complete len:227 (+),score=36.61 TRINITY_DN16210_c0_g1_i8:18-698(+)